MTCGTLTNELLAWPKHKYVRELSISNKNFKGKWENLEFVWGKSIVVAVTPFHFSYFSPYSSYSSHQIFARL